MSIAVSSIAIPATILGTVLAYLTFKHQRLSSEGEIRRELEDRLSGEFDITTPLLARRVEEINWRGDFPLTVDRVEVFETHRGKWKKWLPRHGFDGRAKLHISFHGTEVPPEEELIKHFVAQNPHTIQLNKHLDNPCNIEVLLDTADIDYITNRYIHIFREMIQDTCFRIDNPNVDKNRLLHPKNTNVTYRNGHLYNTLTQSKMFPVMLPEKEPENSDRLAGHET
jgi:hypothetical protein